MSPDQPLRWERHAFRGLSVESVELGWKSARSALNWRSRLGGPGGPCGLPPTVWVGDCLPELPAGCRGVAEATIHWESGAEREHRTYLRDAGGYAGEGLIAREMAVRDSKGEDSALWAMA